MDRCCLAARHRATVPLLVLCILLCMAARPIFAVPTCALLPDSALGFDQSPLFSMVETQLLASKTVTFVERAELARVLKEQQLSLMFSPEGGNARVAIGQLLNADLLVLLKADEVKNDGKPLRLIRLVISDAHTGVRLLVGTVPWTAAVETDANQLLDQIQRGVAKAEEKNLYAITIPPLTSKSLLHEHDYLADSYAQVLAQGALEMKGLVVVEVAEAQAIMQELALKGGGNVERSAPVFLSGDYRVDGVADTQRVTIHLTLRKGTTPLKEITRPNLAPTEVGAFLLASAHQLLAGLSTAPPPAWDATLEAAQLARYARMQRDTGNYPAALQLFEASLLLKPDEPQTLYAAAATVGKVITTMGTRFQQSDLLHDIPTALLLHQRLRQYLDRYQQRTDPTAPDVYYADPNGDFFGEQWYLVGYAPILYKYHIPEMQECISDYTQWLVEEKGRLEYVLAHDLSSLKPTRRSSLAMRTVGLVQAICRSYGRPCPQYYAEMVKALRLAHARPELEEDVVTYSAYGFVANMQMTQQEREHPDFANFVDKVAVIGGENMQALAAFWRAYQPGKTSDFVLPRVAKLQTTPPKMPSQPTANVKLTPMPLTIVDTAGMPLPRRPYLVKDAVSCGPDIDAFYSTSNLFLLKGNTLTSVYTLRSGNEFRGIWYDGRLLWLLAQPYLTGVLNLTDLPKTFLLAIDPRTMKVVEFTHDDGVPPAIDVRGMAWKPGKIVLTGCSGKSWCAIFSLDTDGKKSVDIFYEAQTYPSAEVLSSRGVVDATYAYRPSSITVLFDPVTQEKRMLVGRTFKPDENHFYTCSYPLLVDPAARTVTVVPQLMRMSPDGQHDLQRGGTLFFANYATSQFVALDIHTLTMKPQKLSLDGRLGYSFLDGGAKVHIYDFNRRTSWYVGDAITGSFKQIDMTSLPPKEQEAYLLYQLANHTIVLLSHGTVPSQMGTVMYQVEME